MDGDPEKNAKIENDTLNKNTIEEYIGTNNGFYKILQLYTDLFNNKYNKDIDKFISGELPRVVDGPLYAAFHGIIQLGYGYPYRSAQVCIEGLAMSAHQYTALFPDNPSNPKRTDISRFGRGKTDILDVCKRLRDDKARLQETMEKPVTALKFPIDSSPVSALLQYESDYFAGLYYTVGYESCIVVISPAKLVDRGTRGTLDLSPLHCCCPFSFYSLSLLRRG